jgi:hypothetical protein
MQHLLSMDVSEYWLVRSSEVPGVYFEKIKTKKT